jgi:hypothetical protein
VTAREMADAWTQLAVAEVVGARTVDPCRVNLTERGNGRWARPGGVARRGNGEWVGAGRGARGGKWEMGDAGGGCPRGKGGMGGRRGGRDRLLVPSPCDL